MAEAPKKSLHDGFLWSAARFPDRLALCVDGESLTYEELNRRAAMLAGLLVRSDVGEESNLTAVFAYRTRTAFVGVLAALFRGHGYVPLNRTFPPERTRVMLERAGCRSLIVDRESAEQLPEVVGGMETPLVIVVPDADDVSELARRLPHHRVLGTADVLAAEPIEPTEVDPNSIAYLLFTSGSTGIPKGVMVAHRNVRHFLDIMVERYDVQPDDRFSQTFDMTFDLSVFDMFVAWDAGASLHCLPQVELIKPGRFIREQELTIWFSVPSTGIFMKRLGMLKPGRYPSLRWSLFCGEPLPIDIAAAWAEAAPASTVENLYGPTELTIACTLYRYDSLRTPGEAHNGIVPIGAPYPGMEVLVVDEQGLDVPEGSDGELLLTGPQVTLGYWRDPDKTAAAFVTPPGRNAVYYRTGDRVRRPRLGEPIVYLGRVDHQVKVGGHRVELGEIEAVLRDVTGRQDVIAIGWPRTEAGAAGITAFLGGGPDGIDTESVRSAVARLLPEYMVPRTLHILDRLPTNANGKFDRNALLRTLEEAA